MLSYAFLRACALIAAADVSRALKFSCDAESRRERHFASAPFSMQSHRAALPQRQISSVHVEKYAKAYAIVCGALEQRLGRWMQRG